ncbi:helix-turn-helix domain-containing protein [Pseudoteredinibacter isoporae]|uniref:Transcriptional regulator with XRE-family HTH domain n=1 Tax=Pseudoteredinibacter isoporae TaxID=570281 RepID=A0A7X0JU27_9GAMM|nr:helix-turn-helix transcriptional regulator [Pseudoteredinibacter isoporae]MBB6522290.1 transcriptional regulator with XRE-family HTH domain [Pseudoteredinibacter isoporae]NHO87823.1 helix-turn-helix transcriptional regulator [Pseudoteredinibacter isoporae]NIB23846.1 helix-turn-helix transcriptional regulator [Pseudoteredinibacter isoporae]
MSQVVTYNGIVGYQIEKLRDQRGYDQATLARKAGLSQPVLSRLEKGVASITMDQLFMLANALNVSPSEIIKEAETNARYFRDYEKIEVLSTKQANSVSSSGSSNTKAVLTGAAIGVALAMLLS